MSVLLHGLAGGWDELLIAAVAVGVLWLAVKLAGRKPAEGAEDEATAPERATDEIAEEHKDPAHPPASTPG